MKKRLSEVQPGDVVRSQGFTWTIRKVEPGKIHMMESAIAFSYQLPTSWIEVVEWLPVPGVRIILTKDVLSVKQEILAEAGEEVEVLSDEEDYLIVEKLDKSCSFPIDLFEWNRKGQEEEN